MHRHAELILDQIADLQIRIDGLEKDITATSRKTETAAGLTTIVGVGPVTAAAILAGAPGPSSFRRGRDFSAWMGLTPRQNVSGGKERLGQKGLRRWLITGAISVVKRTARNGAPHGSWLARMMERQPKMLVAVALANRTGRMLRAIKANAGPYNAHPGL